MVKEQIALLLGMQADMNAKVDLKWLNNHNRWWRAIWIEAGELVTHHGYKWWKHEDCDLPAVQMEIIDILHFGLSQLIQEEMSTVGNVEDIHAFFDEDDDVYTYRINNIVSKFEHNWNATWPHLDDAAARGENMILIAAEDVARAALVEQFNIGAFKVLVEAADMSFEDMVQRYIAKNVLNFFRQDYGYKQGTYIKDWNGEEDNIHLERLMQEIMAADAVVGDIPHLLYKGLESIYQSLPEVQEQNAKETA